MSSGPLARTAALIEDVEFLLDHGAGWQEVLQRTGYEHKSLERLLARQGHQTMITQAKARDRERTYA